MVLEWLLMKQTGRKNERKQWRSEEKTAHSYTTAGMNKFEDFKLDSKTYSLSLKFDEVSPTHPMERPCDVYKWFEMAPIGGGNIRIYISFCKLIEVE